MTAPATGSAAASTSTPRTSTPSGRGRADIKLAGELALVALSLAAVFSLNRLFSDGSFLGPVAGAAIASHALAAALRRAGVNLAVAAAVSAAMGALAIVWLVEPSTTTYGVPGTATWQALGRDLDEAGRQFGDVVAPVAVSPGFVLVAAIGAWTAAFLADSAAFRLEASVEATIPSLANFVFGSALGSDNHRSAYTALYLAALLVYLLVRAAGHRSQTTAWFAGRRRGGAGAIVQAGVGLVAVAVLAALVVGPAVPGADSKPLVAWRDRDRGDGAGNRVTVSPLVDIRARLVEQSSVEVFTVQTKDAAPAYWRLTSLDRFNGDIWSSVGTYGKADGTLPAGTTSRAATAELEQEFSVGPLSSIWLPAAYRPVAVDAPSDTRYDRNSGSLLSAEPTAAQARYKVRSQLPQLTQAELANTAAPVPKDIAARYLALPADLPREATDEAHAITDAHATPYAKSRALQDWFRTNFTYSLQVRPGHGSNAIRRFLTNRVGYCEQFAGTYAAMARAVGLPARVAVGFQPGELRADGRFHVSGKEAHAWPEVFIAGYGWVSFEPTPGRGQPGTEDFTGVAVPGPQAEDPDPTATTLAPPTVPTEPSEPAEAGPAPNEVDTEAGSPAGERDRATPWPLVVLAVLVALACAWLVGAPLVRARRRRRRRARAATTSQRVLVAWHEAEEILAVAAGLPRRPSETPREYAARVTLPAGVSPGAMSALADDTVAAGYSPVEVDDEVAERAVEAAAEVEDTLRARASRAQRLKWAVDPRTLVRR